MGWPVNVAFTLGGSWRCRLATRSGPRRTGLAALLAVGLMFTSILPGVAQDLTGQRFVLPNTRKWTGDFSGMLTRRTIRILVPYSRTLFFVDRGRQMGVVAEFGRSLEGWINAQHQSRTLRLHV